MTKSTKSITKVVSQVNGIVIPFQVGPPGPLEEAKVTAANKPLEPALPDYRPKGPIKKPAEGTTDSSTSKGSGAVKVPKGPKK